MQFAEWHRTPAPIDDEGEAPDLGAEILDSSLEFIGDVGRDPIRGLEDPGAEWNVND